MIDSIIGDREIALKEFLGQNGNGLSLCKSL